MNLARRVGAAVVALPVAVLPVAALPVTAVHPAGAARTATRTAHAAAWRIAASAHFGAPTNASGYAAVVATGKRDAWVFGGTNPGGPSTPVAEHWDGTRWRPSPLPSGLSDFIVAASASAADNVWAVSDAYALHWNGSRWSVAKRWTQPGEVTSVAAISPDDVWVFGPTGFGITGRGAWHYDGRHWTRVSGRASAAYRASAVSRRDIWAITAGAGGGSVIHYNGAEWRRMSPGPALARTHLDGILAVRRRSVWVSATTRAGKLVMAHWNGRRWRRFTAPVRAHPERFASDGRGGVWIPATAAAGSSEWILHLWRSGRWQRARLSDGHGRQVGVGDLALIPRTRSLWGSGGFLTKTGGGAAVWAHGRQARRQARARRSRPAGPHQAAGPHRAAEPDQAAGPHRVAEPHRVADPS